MYEGFSLPLKFVSIFAYIYICIYIYNKTLPLVVLYINYPHEFTAKKRGKKHTRKQLLKIPAVAFCSYVTRVFIERFFFFNKNKYTTLQI